MASFGAFLTFLFSFPQEEEKMKQMNTLHISDFINTCRNYIYIYIYIYIIHIFITELYMVHGFFVTEHS